MGESVNDQGQAEGPAVNGVEGRCGEGGGVSGIVEIFGQKHVAWTCKTCGVIATCPENLYAERQKSGGFNHCPNGHQWGWTKEGSEDEKIRRERDQLKQRIAEKDDAIRRERENRHATERQLIAQKAATTRLRNRASAGVCPCCNRTFIALQRHMTTKHPQFKADGGNVVEARA